MFGTYDWIGIIIKIGLYQIRLNQVELYIMLTYIQYSIELDYVKINLNEVKNI